MSPSTEARPAPAPCVRPAIPDVLEEHLEELAFGELRLRSLAFSVEAPADRQPLLAARCAAHREGLRIGGATSRAMAERLLGEGAPSWTLAAAAWTWLDLAHPDALALAVRVQEVRVIDLPDWREGMRWLPPAATDAMHEDALRQERPLPYRHLVLDAALWHRRLPQSLAARAATDPEPLVRWPVARHAGHALEPSAAQGLLRPLLDDADRAVRAAALWSLVLVDRAAALARAAASDLPVALRVLGLFGGDDAVPRLASALADEERRPAAIAGLVDHGSRAALEALAVHEEAALEPLARIVGSFDAGSGVAGARAAWPLATGDLRLWHGNARPWDGAPAARPARWDWHSALLDQAGDGRLRRLVEDGLLGEAPRTDVEVGA